MLYSWWVAVDGHWWIPARRERRHLSYSHIETFFTMFTRRLFKME
jgi:hypothetical protein